MTRPHVVNHLGPSGQREARITFTNVLDDRSRLWHMNPQTLIKTELGGWDTTG